MRFVGWRTRFNDLLHATNGNQVDESLTSAVQQFPVGKTHGYQGGLPDACYCLRK